MLGYSARLVPVYPLYGAAELRTHEDKQRKQVKELGNRAIKPTGIALRIRCTHRNHGDLSGMRIFKEVATQLVSVRDRHHDVGQHKIWGGRPCAR